MSLDKEATLIEEYKALRSEILLCLERRITIISYGLTAIGVLVGAGIAAVNYGNAVFAILVFLVVLPFSAAYVVDIWLAETRRARRASHYNWYLEKKLASIQDAKADPFPLEWESHIRKVGASSLFTEHYDKTVRYFTLIAAGSFGVGCALLLGEAPDQFAVSFAQIKKWSGPLSFFSALFFGAWLFIPRNKQAKWLHDEFNKEPTYPPQAAARVP